MLLSDGSVTTSMNKKKLDDKIEKKKEKKNHSPKLKSAMKSKNSKSKHRRIGWSPKLTIVKAIPSRKTLRTLGVDLSCYEPPY